MTKYPEHEKLKEVQPFSQKIGEFLEWLEDDGLHIMRYDPSEFDWVDDRRTISRMLADFFWIDLGALEEEKRQMLAELATPLSAPTSADSPASPVE